MLPYGDLWRASRRLFTKYFNSSNPSINQPRDIKYVRRFLGQLLQKPNDFLQHVRTLVGSTTLSMTYSIDVQPYNDPNIKTADEATEAIAELFIAGSFLVDIIPILKYVPAWFPGARFQRKAAMMQEHAARVRNFSFAATEKLMASGDYDPSLVSEGLREMQSSDLSNQNIDLLKDVAAMTYLGGTDTTASVIGTFFLAMVCYPEVQTKAQAELDKVLIGRLPEHSDLNSLPYLSALVKELYRWQPPIPLAAPRQLTSDDLYNGYHIAAHSVVVFNVWAMSNDERDYPEPREFRPERFLKNGKLDSSVRDPMDIVFGFGRRVCPGKHIAHSTVTLAVASVLSNFDLLREVDKNGQEIQPKREYTAGAIRRLFDFPCVIKPRSHYAVELIRSSSGLDLVG
jgi:cytochrome P450